MRITQLTPGTGHFYCGNCLRENTLARALRGLGHDVTMIPLYLPVFMERDPAPLPPRIFLGGINLYLRHKLPMVTRLPGFLTRLLDAPGLLRWSSRQGDMTDAAKHADLTLAMLRCEDTGQLKEIRHLLRWMKEHDPPDVVSLCNVLLAGLARPIKQELDVPVVCNLHGEDGYLDALPEPKRTEAWRVLRDRVNDIDAFIPVSGYYAGRMRDRLGIEDDRLHVVHNGIDLEGVEPASRGAEAPVLGYLARMCPDKGLHTLVDAFIELKRRDSIPDLRMRIAGVQLKVDRRFVAQQRSRLQSAGFLSDVTFLPNITREAKLQHLRTLDVFSVPATCGEAFGLYVLEAMAHGIPVVQPRHGAFPEILERAAGGLLCEPDDAISLADELERVLTDEALAASMAYAGRHSVLDHFNAERMAGDVAAVYHATLSHAPANSPSRTTPVEA